MQDARPWWHRALLRCRFPVGLTHQDQGSESAQRLRRNSRCHDRHPLGKDSCLRQLSQVPERERPHCRSRSARVP